VVFPQTVELPSVVVEGVLPMSDLAPSAGTTSLDSAAIEASAAPDLSALLSSISGVIISPTGANGAQVAISLRGSTSNQVLVLVDGVRATDPATGQTDLSRIDIPLDQIESIEVQRGALSAQYGADAVGGVIHIHTKKKTAAPSVDISAQNTSFLPSSVTVGSGLSATTVPFVGTALVDGQTLNISANTEYLSAWAKAERSANNYPYYDSNGVRRARTNADLLSASGGLQGSYPLSVGELSTSARMSYRSLGVPGTLDSPTPSARQQDWNGSLSLRFSTDSLFSGALAMDLSPYAQFGGVQYRESDSSETDEHCSYRAGADTSFSWIPPWNGELRGGASFRYDRLDSSVVTTSTGSSPQRFSGGAFIQPRIELGKWALIPALRYDATSDFPSGVSASLGALRDITEDTVLRGSISSAYRAPSFDDLYWPASSGVEGNPDLKPESAYSADVSVAHNNGQKSWSIGAFGRYVQDVILWQPDASGTWKPSNYGNALYPGIELEAAAPVGDWQICGNYTFLYSFVLSGNLTLADDKRVPYVPVHSASLSASRSVKNFKSAFMLTYKSLRYTTTGNVAYLPSNLIADIRLQWKLSPRTDLEFLFQNCFDEQYEVVLGYPMPGFSVSAKCTVHMGGQTSVAQ
jgi:outer membrane cobalamin receptor